MKTLTVFDPAMCCSTGVCGSDVDQVLVDFFRRCAMAEKPRCSGRTLQSRAATDEFRAKRKKRKRFLRLPGRKDCP